MKDHEQGHGVATAVQEAPASEDVSRDGKPKTAVKSIEIVDVPGPEDAWLRGGTAVPEGSTTEAATGRGRPAARVEETAGSGRPADRRGKGSGGTETRRPGAVRTPPPREGGPSGRERFVAGGERRPSTAAPGSPSQDDGRQPLRSSAGGADRRPMLPERPPKRRPPRQEPRAQQPDRKPLSLDDVTLPGDLEETETDPWKRAMALFSRIDREGADGDAGAVTGSETTAGEASPSGSTAAGKGPTQGEPGRTMSPASTTPGSVSAGRADGELAGTGGSGQRSGGSVDPARSDRRELAGRNGRPSDESRKSRPSRPIYTLQDIHERTGIPYATLALFAVSHRDSIPFLGERHSPAYPREGLDEFCRIYEEKNPGWQRPAEGTEPGWDDEAGLAVRLEALGEDQERLATELRGLLAELRKPWTGEAEWIWE